MTGHEADCAVDTSVAVPALLIAHPWHATAQRTLSGRRPALTAHSAAETYSVLTRMGRAADAADVVRAMASQFVSPVVLSPEVARLVPDRLAAAGVVGGAVYDALVGLAAHEAGLPLMTRDGRALATYAALGVRVELLPA
ncbi:PIN domain-containing protein [Klenkia sp. LSe6-5]|uniref:Ribonuclease VapC n=1 Tax=Klenkia sesuvii TaxID=3103137 RepID=A0ABU8DRB9_9ACTN